MAKITPSQLEGSIRQSAYKAQAKSKYSYYGIFLVKLEDIKTEFIQAVTEARPADGVAFIQALDAQDGAMKSAQVKYLAKINKEG